MARKVFLLITSLIIFALAGNISANAEDTQSFNSTIFGYAEADKDVTLTVLMPVMTQEDWAVSDSNDGIVAYFEQGKTDKNGYYEFRFNLNRSAGTYMALTSVSGENGVRTEYLGSEKDFRFESDFEGYTGGVMPNGWDSVSGFKPEHYTTAKGKSGGTALALRQSNGVRLIKRFDDVNEGIYLLSFDFKADDVTHLNYFRLLTDDYDEEPTDKYLLESFYIGPTSEADKGEIGFYKNTTGWEKVPITEYEAGIWYHIDAWIDLDMDRITYCVDNAYNSDTYIRDTALGGILLQMVNGSSKNLYFDNFLFAKMSNGEIRQRKSVGQLIPQYLANDVRISLKSEKTGNVFFEEENINVTCSITNCTTQDKNLKVNFELIDENGVIVKTEEKEVFVNALGKADIQPNLNGIAYGIYMLRAEIKNDLNETDAECYMELARSVYADSLNERVGINTHFNTEHADYEKTVPLIQGAGFGITRDVWSWRQDENGFSEYVKDLLESAEMLSDNQIMTLPIFGLTNSYVQSICQEGHQYCTCESGLEAIKNYAKHFVLSYAEKVPFEYVEIGNEPNMKAEAGCTAEVYGKLLESCYMGVKEASEELGRDIKVVGFAVNRIKAGVDTEYIKTALSVTENRIVDVISVHPYHDISNMPEEKGSWQRLTWVEQAEQLVNLRQELNLEDVELWATETGWQTVEGITEIQQAKWTVRLVALNDAYSLFDKIVFYEMTDSGASSSRSDNYNYGIINTWVGYDTPYAAKASYLAIANYNKLLARASASGEPVISGGVYSVEYIKKNGAKLYMVWSLDGAGSKTLDFGNAAYAKVYDMYGNASLLSLDNGKITVNATKTPVYVEAAEEISVTVNGENIYSAKEVETGDTLKINVNIPGNTGTKNVICALYSGNCLVDVEIKSFSDESTSFDKKCNKECDEIKVFVFNNLTNLNPICGSLQL